MNLISSAAGRRVVRLSVLILGAAMLIYGAQRGEAATVPVQGRPNLPGVCGHWIRRKKLRRLRPFPDFSPGFGDLRRPAPCC